jgi:yecA family protein
VTQPLFSYDEADEILRGDGRSGFIGMSAIDGLMASVVAGPAYIPPDDWRPQVLGETPVNVPGTPQQRLWQTILHHHDEVVEVLAKRPETYIPMFMHDEGRVVIDDWAIGFMLGMGMRGKAWTNIIVSSFRPILAPILSVNDAGRKMMPDISAADLDRTKATAHDHIADAVIALYRHCAKSHSASRRLAKLRTGRRR